MLRTRAVFAPRSVFAPRRVFETNRGFQFQGSKRNYARIEVPDSERQFQDDQFALDVLYRFWTNPGSVTKEQYSINKLLAMASFKGAFDPPLIALNPDEIFQYLRVCIPREGERFDGYSLRNANFVEMCLKSGIGIAFYKDEETLLNDPLNAQHSIRCGDIMSLYCYDDLDGDPDDLYELEHEVPSLSAKAKYHHTIRPPTNSFFPPVAQYLVKFLMETVWDKDRCPDWKPRAAMGTDPNHYPTRKLLLNVCKDWFLAEEFEIDWWTQMRWFLPRGRSVGIFQSTEAMYRDCDPECYTLIDIKTPHAPTQKEMIQQLIKEEPETDMEEPDKWTKNK